MGYWLGGERFSIIEENDLLDWGETSFSMQSPIELGTEIDDHELLGSKLTQQKGDSTEVWATEFLHAKARPWKEETR